MNQIHKILIANRAEIAVRVIRACRDLHIKSVAVFTDSDHECLNVKIADEAYRIGTDAIRGYLDVARIVEITKAYEDSGIIFIGPKSEVIHKMRNKNIARKSMDKNGISIVLGTEKLNYYSTEEIKIFAEKIVYPVILKTSDSGGGRGIRFAHKEQDLENAFEFCKREALTYFNNDEVFMEKYVVNPRHIEFQILGDNYGNIIHLCERGYSIQRRHQKMIEIAPCPGISDNLRKTMGVTAVPAAKAVGYTNSRAIEFLLDDYNRFYFMEMNIRIQVQHSIIEEITGIDLIVRQIRIAAGEILDLEQSDIKPRGFAIEARITAENVWKNFIPSPGKIGEYYSALLDYLLGLIVIFIKTILCHLIMIPCLQSLLLKQQVMI